LERQKQLREHSFIPIVSRRPILSSQQTDRLAKPNSVEGLPLSSANLDTYSDIPSSTDDDNPLTEEKNRRKHQQLQLATDGDFEISSDDEKPMEKKKGKREDSTLSYKQRIKAMERGKSLLTANLRTVATTQAAHRAHQSIKKREERPKVVEDGEMTPEARKLQGNTTRQDVAATGVGAQGMMKGAISGAQRLGPSMAQSNSVPMRQQSALSAPAEQLDTPSLPQVQDHHVGQASEVSSASWPTSRKRSEHSSNIAKTGQQTPLDTRPIDRILRFQAQLRELAHRRVNIMKSIQQMTEVIPEDEDAALDQLSRRRENLEGLRQEAAEISRLEYQVGLKLHRAWKRQDSSDYQPTGPMQENIHRVEWKAQVVESDMTVEPLHAELLQEQNKGDEPDDPLPDSQASNQTTTSPRNELEVVKPDMISLPPAPLVPLPIVSSKAPKVKRKLVIVGDMCSGKTSLLM
jgi:hypothetical protein